MKTIRFNKDRSKNVAALAKELGWWYENVIMKGTGIGARSDECTVKVGGKLYWDVSFNYDWYTKQLDTFSTHKIEFYGGQEPHYEYKEYPTVIFKFVAR